MARLDGHICKALEEKVQPVLSCDGVAQEYVKAYKDSLYSIVNDGFVDSVCSTLLQTRQSDGTWDWGNNMDHWAVAKN